MAVAVADAVVVVLVTPEITVREPNCEERLASRDSARLVMSAGVSVVVVHDSMVIRTPGAGVPTVEVDEAVTEQPVVVEQSKPQLDPAMQAVVQISAVRVLHSSSSSSPSPPPLPPPIVTPQSGGQRRQGPLQKGKQPVPVPGSPFLADGVGVPDSQVMVLVLRTESLVVWDQG